MTTSSVTREEIATLLLDGKRRCRGCGAVKTLDCFNRGKAPGGVSMRCRDCVAAFSAEWSRRPEVKARKRARYEERYDLDRVVRLRAQRVRGALRRIGHDPEKLKAKRARRYAKNAEAERNKARAYRAANPVKARAAWLTWKAANPWKVKSSSEARSRRLVETADGSVTKQRVRALLDRAVKCPYCGVPLSRSKKSIDHVVPLARGGAHTISNLTVCCWPCNLRKGASRHLLL